MTLKKLGRYDLMRVLGKGAMGLVYEGRDPNLDRRVAIKTIKVENLSEEAAAEYESRFRTEARSAARLQHPNIVSVYDSDRDGDIAFLVMEYIEGEDLKHHLDQGKRHTFEQTLAVMRDLLSALEYAHRAKIVHRDIKPANLLIESSGRVKLTDFGVARIQDSGDATRTQGSMVGTLKYMSPEQVQGMPVDSRTDLFAAGVVLYQLLTGRRPFDGDSDFAIIQRIVAQDAVAPTLINPKLPTSVDAVVARALAKAREQRFATAQEFVAALEGCARQEFDPTAVAPSPAHGTGRTSTWTGTVQAGESLVDTQSGLGTGTRTGTSVVTQELELVYWKDVKDSTDIEDLEGFLMKFPQGIYADLARRRLRRLARGGDGSTGGTGTGMGMGMGTDVYATPGAAAIEKTQMMLRSGKVGQLAALPIPASPASPTEPVAKPGLESAWQALAGTAEPPGTQRVAVPADAVVAESTLISAPHVPVDDRSASPAQTTMHPSEEGELEQGNEVGPGGYAAPQDAKNVGSAGSATVDAGRAVPPSTSAPKRMPWILAGLVVLAGMAFFGVNRMSGPGPAAEGGAAAPSAAVSTTAQTAAPASAAAAALASDGTSAARIAAAPVAPAAAASVAGTPAVPGRALAARPAASGASAAAPSPAATASAAALAATRKAAIDKDKDKLAKPPVAGVPGAPSTATASSITESARPTRPGGAGGAGAAAAIAVPADLAGGGPRQACEDRTFIAFQNCMAEQCARPSFTNHPLCVERRTMEQRRRESEQRR